jgi:hypothetical protein
VRWRVGGGKEPGVTRQNLPWRRPAGPRCQPAARRDPVYAAGGGVAAAARGTPPAQSNWQPQS